MKNKKLDFSGFTLIEGVLSLVVLAFIMLLMQVFVTASMKISQYSSGKCALEWHLFLAQLENTSKDWQIQKLESQRLTFIDLKEAENQAIKDPYFEITPYKNQLKIKKRGGYEPLLTKVVSSHFSLINQEVSISVVMEDGKQYQSKFPNWSKE